MRIIRHRLDVDDQVHRIIVPDLDQPVLSIAARTADTVDLWVLDDPGLPVRDAALLVVGTGQVWSADGTWLGSCVTPGGTLVWHLIELEDA